MAATFAIDTEHKSQSTEVNEVVQYVRQENVALNTRQIQVLTAMNLTLQDLRNINVESYFGEFCQELNLSFGPKIKLKSAIKKLRSSAVVSKSMIDNPHIHTLVAMGFSQQNAMFALEMNQNDLIKAIEILTNENVISFPAKNQKSTQYPPGPSKKLKKTSSRNTMFSVPIGCIIAWCKDFTEQAV